MAKDRTRSIIDEKRKVLRPFNTILTLPTTDIHEGGLRCIKYNYEWSVIVEGWLLHLTTVNLWSQAYGEDFSGIQQVQKMLIGEECAMPFDCNDVEDCLLTSPTIIAINAQIAQNASDISDNTDNINTNTTNITNLQGRMTSAESAIALHTTEIEQNAADILLQSVLISDNADEIQANDAELANHETRITALEAGSGGNGGGISKTLRTEELIFDFLFTTDEPNIGFAIPPEFTSLKIELSARSTGAQQAIYIFMNNDLTLTNYQSVTVHGAIVNSPAIALAAGASGAPVDAYSITVIHLLELHRDIRRLAHSVSVRRTGDGLAMGANVYGVYWENSDTIENLNFTMSSANWAIGSNIKIWGILEEEVLVASLPIIDNPLVTFDEGGTPFSLPDEQVGVVSSGGNPGNCLFAQSVATNEYISVLINLGEQKLLTDFSFDYFVDDRLEVTMEIWRDGFLAYNSQVFDTSDAWDTFTDALNENGQILELRLIASAPQQDMRIDNWSFTTT